MDGTERYICRTKRQKENPATKNDDRKQEQQWPQWPEDFTYMLLVAFALWTLLAMLSITEHAGSPTTGA